jgi:hypothetical protein
MELSPRQGFPCAPFASPLRKPSVPARALGWVLVWALLLPIAVAGSALAAADPPGLPELVRTKQRSFTIPFRLPKSQDPDADAAAARVVLQASQDLGGTWEAAGEADPSATSFTYTAKADGEYWFRLRAVDRKGRMRGGEGPDMRVLVDAAGPRLAARVWRGADGEIACRYAAADDSISLPSLKVEYKAAGDKAWKPVAAQGILARESPAHLVGEEIWWAGEKVAALKLRITVADSSGNQTVRQFDMESTDPQVDQAALAVEIGLPPLPAEGQSLASSPTTPADGGPTGPAADVVATPAATALAQSAGPNGWAAESAPSWSGGEPKAGAAGRGPHSVLVKRAVTAGTQTAPRRADAGVTQPGAGAAGAVAAAADGGPLEYRGRPLQLTRSRRFAWDYEPPPEQADGRRLRAELWSTRDGGVTWQRAAVDEDGRSPIDVQLPAAGLYGFRLEMVADDPVSAAGPRSGDAPETWLGIDEEPPQVDLQSAGRDGDALVIRYAARDPLLSPRSVRLLYSPHADGPWATIADRVENQGEHRWQPDRSVPARIFVRVEATDAAGNVGGTATSEPVSTSASRFVGRLGGLRPLPAAESP